MADKEAQRIAQDFLDRQGEATVSGDVEATLLWCNIPCRLESLEGEVLVTTQEQMRAICASFIDELRTKRLTHMVRHCRAAEFDGKDTIYASYETRYVQDGKLLSEEPYVGYVTLLRTSERWKISAMRFADSKTSPANATLREMAVFRSDNQAV